VTYSVYAAGKWLSDHECVHAALDTAKLTAIHEGSVQVRDGDIVLAVFGKGFSAIAARRAAQRNNDKLLGRKTMKRGER
jgi:histone H3/H4